MIKNVWSENKTRLTVFGTTQLVVDHDFDAAKTVAAEVVRSPPLMILEMRGRRDQLQFGQVKVDLASSDGKYLDASSVSVVSENKTFSLTITYCNRNYNK